MSLFAFKQFGQGWVGVIVFKTPPYLHPNILLFLLDMDYNSMDIDELA